MIKNLINLNELNLKEDLEKIFNNNLNFYDKLSQDFYDIKMSDIKDNLMNNLEGISSWHIDTVYEPMFDYYILNRDKLVNSIIDNKDWFDFDIDFRLIKKIENLYKVFNNTEIKDYEFLNDDPEILSVYRILDNKLDNLIKEFMDNIGYIISGVEADSYEKDIVAEFVCDNKDYWDLSKYYIDQNTYKIYELIA